MNDITKEDDYVMINSGMHQFQHGKIQSIENGTQIPFAHVALRNRGGDLYAKGNGAYIPLKYCQVIDEETAKLFHNARKEMMKKQRARAKVVNAALAEKMAALHEITDDC